MDRAMKEKLIMRKQVSFSADPEENMIITGGKQQSNKSHQMGLQIHSVI